MRGPIRNLQSAAGMAIKVLTIDDAGSFTLDNVDRLLTMYMLSGMSIRGNLGLENTSSHCREAAQLIADHLLDSRIRPRPHPLDIAVVGDHRRLTELLLYPVAYGQPLVIKIWDHVSSFIFAYWRVFDSS